MKVLMNFLLYSAFALNLQAQAFTPVRQVSINRIDSMPAMPRPYHMLDWKKKALDFDAFVFNEKNKINGQPLIWFDKSYRNFHQETFGLYTALGDSRQGPEHNNGEFHESLNSMAALIGATLVGIDKSNQNGRNYVQMVQNYFNRTNGWNIIMNNTNPNVANNGGGYGRDWWYDVFPNVLYYALCDLYPDIPHTDYIQRTIAEQFCKADSVLNGNYDYSYFDYGLMKGGKNHIPFQQDAAGGHAWVLYAAYKKYGDKRYLKHAKSALDALFAQKESPFYEILLPMSAIVAARMNAEENTHYDVKKIIDWTFDGCKNKKGRYGWGVIVGRWGDYDVSGLQGSITDLGGYAFLMNSIKLSWPFIPMVKYAPEFAHAMGKWILNMANASRLFFPDEIDSKHQWLPQYRNLTKGAIAYEGLRKVDDYGKGTLKGVSPVAIGDGPKWTPKNPPLSMFSIYSTAPVGILGAIVNKTDVDGILKIDCNATDFYAERPYPVWMFYNPYKEKKNFKYHSKNAVDLFDIVSKRYILRNKTGFYSVSIPADGVYVLVELPAGTKLNGKGSQIDSEYGTVICYK